MRGSEEYTKILGVETLEDQVAIILERGAVPNKRVAGLFLLRVVAGEALMEEYKGNPDSVGKFYRANAEQVAKGKVKSITFEDEDVEDYLTGEHLELWKSLY